MLFNDNKDEKKSVTARGVDLKNETASEPSQINMKNEFLFGRMVLTTKKKRYEPVALLREGKKRMILM